MKKGRDRQPISVRLPRGLVEKLDEFRAREGRDRTNAVERILTLFFQKEIKE